MKLVLSIAAAGVSLIWVGPRLPRGRRVVGQCKPSVRDLFRRILGRFRPRQDHADDAFVVGRALMSVSARMHAGQSPHRAWADVAQTLPGHLAAGFVSLGTVAHQGTQPHASVALDAARAATGLAHQLGAELAPVLESCAQGIEESSRAHDEREAALVAPQATARILYALPLLGVVVGTLMGANPIRLFTASPVGGLVACAGGALTLVGRWWIKVLIDRAQLAPPEVGTTTEVRRS